MEITDQVTDLAGLAEMYREPSELAVNKQFSVIDDASARFIDRCPFLILSTTNGDDSIDASPRGGPPGFLQRLDDQHIAIPDLNGNNRLDSLRNIVEHGRAGLLLMIPGKDETVRINGVATLTAAPEILDGFTAELRRPKLAIVVQTNELYGHCAKAFRRGRVWDVESWADVCDAPDLADVVAEQFGMDLEVSRNRLERSYTDDLALD